MNTVGYSKSDAKLSTRSKGEHLLQLGVYAELLESVTGGAASAGTVHLAKAAPGRFDLRQTRYILKRFMAVSKARHRASDDAP